MDATAAGPAVRVEAHVKWARAIARGVRADYRFRRGSSEEHDLEQTACLEVCAAATRFDPGRVPAGGDVGGAFRGFAAAAVRGACKREAVRLRNGGTYHTRLHDSRRPAVEVVYGSELPPDDEGGADRTDEPPDPGEDADEPPDPPAAPAPKPVPLLPIDTRIHVLRAELQAAEQARDEAAAVVTRLPRLATLVRLRALARSLGGHYPRLAAAVREVLARLA